MRTTPRPSPSSARDVEVHGEALERLPVPPGAHLQAAQVAECQGDAGTVSADRLACDGKRVVRSGHLQPAVERVHHAQRVEHLGLLRGVTGDRVDLERAPQRCDGLTRRRAARQHTSLDVSRARLQQASVIDASEHGIESCEHLLLWLLCPEVEEGDLDGHVLRVGLSHRFEVRPRLRVRTELGADEATHEPVLGRRSLGVPGRVGGRLRPARGRRAFERFNALPYSRPASSIRRGCA